MIIFFEYGRLGNQLFQYAGLKIFFPKEKIIFFGCEDLKDVFASTANNITIIPKTKILSRIVPFIRFFLLYLASWKIIGTIREFKSNSEYEIKKRHGLIFNLYIAEGLFFQHHEITNKLNPELYLHDKLLDKAKIWLQAQECYSSSHSLVFVHIRRSDYTSWPSKEYPAVLDFLWYERAMDVVRERVTNPLFLIVTDDIFYAKDLLGHRQDVIISNNSLHIDLALMSLCANGILSASSFSWWGAWFSRNSIIINYSLSASGIYIAPEFWAGHRQEKWYPPGFVSDWIEYL